MAFPEECVVDGRYRSYNVTVRMYDDDDDDDDDDSADVECGEGKMIDLYKLGHCSSFSRRF